MILFLAFLLVPLIEIGLFIQVGGLIGLWPTLGIVVVTAILGTALVRSQGFQELGRLQRSIETLDDPSGPLVNGAMILLAGALLLTPGFFTDAVGFALLIPAVRAAIIRRAASKVAFTRVRTGPRRASGTSSDRFAGDVIDGDYEEVKTDPPSGGPSGWVDNRNRY